MTMFFRLMSISLAVLLLACEQEGYGLIPLIPEDPSPNSLRITAIKAPSHAAVDSKIEFEVEYLGGECSPVKQGVVKLVAKPGGVIEREIAIIQESASPKPTFDCEQAGTSASAFVAPEPGTYVLKAYLSDELKGYPQASAVIEVE